MINLIYEKSEDYPLRETGLTDVGYNKPVVVVTRVFFRGLFEGDPFWPNLGEKLRNIAPSGRPLKIKSVGCSSGEEVYSIAMEARSAGVSAEITGLDVLATNIQLANAGLYPIDDELDKDFLMTIPSAHHQYFFKEGPKYRIDPSIRAMVTFGSSDLRTAAPDDLRADLIVCRRLFDHFTPAMRETTFAVFKEAAKHVHVAYVKEERYGDPAVPPTGFGPCVEPSFLGNFY